MTIRHRVTATFDVEFEDSAQLQERAHVVVAKLAEMGVMKDDPAAENPQQTADLFAQEIRAAIGIVAMGHLTAGFAEVGVSIRDSEFAVGEAEDVDD